MDNNQNVNVQANGNGQEGESTISLRDIIFLVINNWYWFVISVFICMLVAGFAYKAQPKTYEQSAQILLRDDTKKTSAGSQNMDAIFQQMGMESSNLSLENEIYILKSSPLMTNVVRRLGLNNSCSYTRLFSKTAYYKDSPLELNVFNNTVGEDKFSVAIEVTPIDQAKYEYRVVTVNGQKNKGDKKVAAYNQLVKFNKDVTFSIDKTHYFNKSHIGMKFDMSHAPAYNTARGILGRLQVARADKMASIINITYSDRNQRRCQEIIDTLIAVYNEDVINDKNKVAQKTESFIVERIALISGELGAVDSQVAQLQQQANLTDQAATTGILLQTSTRYAEDVVALSTELELVKAIREYITNPNNNNELIPANIAVNDAGIQTLIANYNQQMLGLQKLLNTAGPNNPGVKTYEQNLQATRTAIISSVNNVVSSINAKLRSARGQEQRAQGRISSMPTQTKAVTEVERQQKIKEELYLYLLNKREENALNLAVTVANAKVVESATYAGKVSPRLMMYDLVGLIMGVAIPAVVMFCIQFFNTKLRGKADVEKALTIPVLGEIPSKPEDKAKEEIIVTANGTDMVTESFRILHSNIPFFLSGEDQKVIQMVSTVPGEGKSYTSINLALSLAYLGKKTCLVDLDVRKRSMSKTIDRHNRMGIIHYLLGQQEEIANIITHSDSSEYLDYIVCEKTPPNATQLLMSDKFDKLGVYLREHYDYIIFDSTPAQIVADAAIINRIADMTAYVMRVGVLNKASFPFIQELSDKQKFKNMAAIITDTPVIKKRYGGYGYGYG
ncbi:MAG: polysaccharide biosynthesis tyrosine autokinase [Bacteroidales bacterium]|nr:polysaccharide biosynthesis tyrosine autokinase [Bacteroidales bacterium]